MLIELIFAALGFAVLVVVLETLAPQPTARFWLALERWRARLVLKRVRLADGAVMPYLDGGQGEALLLVHGFGGDKDNFTRIAGMLTRRYRVIVPDLPGFGEATRDPQVRYTIVDQVERLREFTAQLGLNSFHLGGNSMGGFIAAEYAVCHAPQVASLWLLDPAGTEIAQDTPMLQRYRASGQIPLLLRSTEEIGALLKAIASRPPLLPPSVKTVLARRGVADHALHLRILQQVANDSPTLDGRLSRITAPTLVVWGTEDKVLNPEAAAYLQQQLPHGRAIVMAGIGHVPMMEAPKAAAVDYLRFRAELAAAATAGRSNHSSTEARPAPLATN
jgi:pimeloyl-ACP methyl ester carboxylesterase